MLEISKPAPDFTLPGVFKGEVMDYKLSDYRGRWVIVFFYTGDRTSVCSTEVRSFNDHIDEFNAEKISLLGISVDSLDSHKAWASQLGLEYPLLSDGEGKVSREWGLYDEEAKSDRRGSFIIDPDGKLRFMMIGEPPVGRSVFEILRITQALQTGEACPVDWRPGQPTL